MGESVCSACCESRSEKRVVSRWWSDSPVVRCAFVLTLLTIPPCSGLEETAHMGGSDTSQLSYYWAEVNFTYTDPVTNKDKHETSEGKFGAKGLIETRTGQIVHVRNKENKTYGCDDYNIKLPKTKWIALVERGNCYFGDKIKMATRKYNASAVVVYNNENKDSITIMQHDVKDQVSIFVKRKIGLKLARLADEGVKVIVTITPGRQDVTSSGDANSISKTSVLFVSISFIVLMIISLAWLVFYYIQRFRYAHAKERLARRLASAAKKAIAKIPQKTVKSGDKELDSDFDQCAICIESYKPHDVIRTMPCKHVFHKSCVDPWLLDQRSCPMCKLDILRAYGMQVCGSQDSMMHGDAEAGTVVMPSEEPEASSTTGDEQPPHPHHPHHHADTEVKVLLLPHTCLHLPAQPPDQPSPSSTPSSPQHCHAPSCSKHSSSAAASAASRMSCSHSAELQALMDQEEEEEEDEGFDERRPCRHHHHHLHRDRGRGEVDEEEKEGEEEEDDVGEEGAVLDMGPDSLQLVVRSSEKDNRSDPQGDQ